MISKFLKIPKRHILMIHDIKFTCENYSKTFVQSSFSRCWTHHIKTLRGTRIPNPEISIAKSELKLGTHKNPSSKFELKLRGLKTPKIKFELKLGGQESWKPQKSIFDSWSRDLQKSKFLKFFGGDKNPEISISRIQKSQ